MGSLKAVFASVILIVTCALVCKNSNAALIQVRMNLGEIRVLDLGLPKDLYLSKKGVILAEHLSGPKWQIVGLKKGQVLMQNHTQKWLVTIEASRSSSMQQASPVPSWICSQKGVRCLNGPSIEGQIDHYSNYLQAKSWCLLKPSCLFLAKMGRQAQQELKGFLLDRLLPSDQIRQSQAGHTVVEVVCDSDKSNRSFSKSQAKRINEASAGLLEKGLISIKCQDPKDSGLFQVNLTLYMMNDLSLDQSGFDLPITIGSRSIGKISEALLFEKINQLLTENKAEIVARPSIRASIDQDAMLSSGGEFRSTQAHLNSLQSSLWKSYGMTVKLKLTEASREAVLLTVDLCLSVPGQSQSPDRLKSHSLKTKIQISFDQDVKLGSIDFSSAQEENKSQFGLSDTPLVGPLFKASKISEGRLKGFISVRISRPSKHQGV